MIVNINGRVPHDVVETVDLLISFCPSSRSVVFVTHRFSSLFAIQELQAVSVMPLATSAIVCSSTLSSSKLTGRICGERSNISTSSSASPFQKVFAMREINNAATEDVKSVTKLPNLRILEVLGASQPNQHVEPLVAEKPSTTSAACLPMTVAVAEFKGPQVHGVVRFAQDNSSGQQKCTIEAVIDGLAPGAHGWSVHEFGDLTRGPLSTGPAYTFPPPANPTSVIAPDATRKATPGRNCIPNLGSLWVDSAGHVQSTASYGRIVVADIIGRSVVLYGQAAELEFEATTTANVKSTSNGVAESVTTRVAAAVIARSGRPSSLTPQLCNCDGSLLWQANANRV